MKSSLQGEKKGEERRELGMKPCEMPTFKGAEEVDFIQAPDIKQPGPWGGGVKMSQGIIKIKERNNFMKASVIHRVKLAQR